jgi:ATP-dependent Clp protease ATP-binding subunit ClpA
VVARSWPARTRAQVGVANIRAHMEKHAAEAEALARRRLELSAQASRLRNQLDYEQRRDARAAVKAARAEAKRLAGELAKLDKEAAAADAAAAKLTEELVAEVRMPPLQPHVSAGCLSRRAPSTKVLCRLRRAARAARSHGVRTRPASHSAP